MARAVIQFAVTGMAAVAVLGLVAVRVLQSTGRSEAIRDAKRETALASRLVVPLITGGLVAGEPGAVTRMDRVVHESILRGPVTRVKIWDGSGQIVYSDAHRLIGRSYKLGAGELAALHSGRADADVSDLSKPENRFERGRGKLLEVYLGVRAPDGQKLLFEDYLTYSSVAASGQRLWLAFAPALIVTLLVLELAQIPLAWSMARKLRSGQAERETLLQRSIDASALERRRIARDLHDGAVQNLAGVSYSLSAAALAIAQGDPGSVRQKVDDAAAETRKSMRELRTMLVDIYPPNLRRTGLAAALSDLVSAAPGEVPEIAVEVPAELDLPEHALPVLYRVAQEAVRNVISHADAHHAKIAAWRQDGSVVLTVEDDGRGFEPGPAPGQERRRHFGLRMLHDLAEDSGGELHVDSQPGHGTCIRIEIPV